MLKINIDSRLKSISNLIRGEIIADIGSDHAYLPIWLYQNNKIKKAYAVDISQNSVIKIKNNLKKYNISEENIIPVLSDGFKNFKNNYNFSEITDIIIAGIGGKNIAEIISEIKNPSGINFILQPSRKEDYLRDFLYKNKFNITSEIITEENKMIYNIINAKYTGESYAPNFMEIFAGKNITHQGYINKITKRLENILIKLDNKNGEKYNIKTEFGTYSDIKNIIAKLNAPPTSSQSFTQKLAHYFNKYNINFTGETAEKFYLFTEYLISENEKYNLTSIKDIDEIIVKHYIDSVIILKYFNIPENSRIIDVGTGAGFPALPLHIMRNDLQITFLDSSNKKINFIKNSPAINTNNLKFLCGRAEDFGKDLNLRETYDFALSRAVAKLNILCELAAPFIKPDGYFIAYKSKNAKDEIRESKNALKTLGLEIADIIEFDLNENGRSLIKIKKTKKISSAYPRNFSEITKNPL